MSLKRLLLVFFLMKCDSYVIINHENKIDFIYILTLKHINAQCI